MKYFQAALVFVSSLSCCATTAQAVLWNQLAGGTYDFNTAGNWGVGGVPNANGAFAQMSGDYTGVGGNIIAQLNSSVTLGQLWMGDTSGNNANLTISPVGGTTITLNNNGSRAIVRGYSASGPSGPDFFANYINTGLILQDDAELQAQSAGGLRRLWITGVISGSAGVYVGDAAGTYKGEVLIQGNNSFTGGVTIQGGAVLRSENANALNSNLVTFGTLGGTLQTNAGANVRGLVGSDSSANIIRNPLIRTLTINTQLGDSFTYSGVFLDVSTLSIVKNGAGTQIIAGSQSADYDGAVTINDGILNIQRANGLGTTVGGTSVASGGTLALQGGVAIGAEALTLNGSGYSSGGALRSVSGTNSYAGAITLGSASRINSDAGTLTLSGGITGSGQNLTVGGAGNTTISSAIATDAGTLTKDGTGTLVLSVASTYTGATNVQAGVLNIRHNTALGTTAGGVTVSSGAALEIQNTISVGNETLNLNGTGVANGGALRNISGTNSYGGTLVLASASRVNSDAGTLTLNNNIIGGGQNLTVGGAGNVTFTGILATGAGTLTKDGAGTLTLGGPNNNSFTGLTTVSNGTAALNKSAGSNATSGSLLISGGTLRWDVINQLSSTAQVTLTSGTLNLNLAGVVDEIGKLDLQGGTISNTSSQLQLASSAADAINIRGGVTVPGNLTLNLTSGSGGGVTFDATVNGTATLSNALMLSNSNKSVVVNNGTAATDLQITGVISESGGAYGFTKSGAGTLVVGGTSNNTYTGLTTVADGVLALNKTNNINAAAGNVLVAGGTLRWDVANQLHNAAQVTMTSGVIDSSVFDGFGKLNLQGGTVTGSGQFNLSDSGNDAITIRGGVTVPFTLALTNGSSGGLTFDASNNGTATLSGTFILSSSNKNIVVGNGSANVDLQILGNVTEFGGTYGFTKTGAGTLLLAGASNSYQGATNVDQGRLLVNGVLTSGGGAVAVASGATLGGSGTINRAVNISAGGTLSPGNSPDEIFTGDLTLAPLAVYEIEILGPGVGDGVTGYDQTAVTGGVSLNGALLDVFAVSGISVNDTFTIINNDGADAVIGTFAGLAEGASFLAANYYTFTITYQGGVNSNDVVLTLTHFQNPVPEPSTLLLLAGVLLGGGALRWQKRRGRDAVSV